MLIKPPCLYDRNFQIHFGDALYSIVNISADVSQDGFIFPIIYNI